MRLSKLLYRATRGMAWVQFFDIDEPLDDFYGKELDLCIYFVIYPANIQNLTAKIERICGSFNQYVMPFPGRLSEVDQLYSFT